ncbi:unnamed protein product [Closterium sp. Naga37s-1]|nr:unnamed protein product [Closterium sp. Naga37s-1]
MAVDSQEAIRLAFLLEPGHSVSSTNGFDYLGTRRFLLKAKAQDATLQRHHWQHVSGVGYADFRAFLRAQRDTWRQEREASREEERRAAPAAPHADVAPSLTLPSPASPHADAHGEREVVREVEKVRMDGMTVVDGRGEEEEGSEERLTNPACEAIAAGQSTVAADSSAGAGADADANNISESTEASPPFTSSRVDSIAAAVAAALGKSEPPVTASSEAAPTAEGPEVDVTATSTRAAADAAVSKRDGFESAGSGRIGSTGREKLEDGAEGVEGAEGEEHRESGIEEEVAIRVSAASGAGAGVSSNADRDGERGGEGGGSEVAASAASAEAASAYQGDVSRSTFAAVAESDSKQQDKDGKQEHNKEQDSKHKDGKQPPSPPSLPAGFTSSICSVPPEASRNVLPPTPPRPGPAKAAAAAGEAEGRKGARRGSEGAGSEGGAGKALETRKWAGEAVAGRGSGEVGPPVRMCAVFDDCLASVNKVQFARHHPDLLAYGAADGTLRLCHVPCSRLGSKAGGAGGKRGAVSVARVKHELKGHTKEVTDFDWSTDDDYLCSSSADKSVRVWDVGSGLCLRISYTIESTRLFPIRLPCSHRLPSPPTYLSFQSHVADFDWSTDDDYLCSSSADKSVCVWDVGSGLCLRIIYTVIPQTCIIFHPQNNNFLVVANSKRELTVMNFSTGRVVSRVAMDSNVTALVADRTTSASSAAAGSTTSSTSSSSGSSGGGGAGKAAAAGAAGAGSGGFGGGAGEADSVVFVGDSEGAIHSFTVDKQSGALQRRHKTVAGVVHPAPVASLHFSPTSVLANGPVLLACSKDGCVRFYTTALELNGYLFLKISLQLSSRATNMNATFCPPLGPSGSGEYIVTGNADHHVYFYDFMKPRSPLVARVPGHKAMVVDVSWNNSNTVLASCDCDGVVALWQRV